MALIIMVSDAETLYNNNYDRYNDNNKLSLVHAKFLIVPRFDYIISDETLIVQH